MKKKPLIFAAITLVIGLYVFFASPNLNPLYADGAFFWLAIISIYTLVATMTGFKLVQYADAHGRQAVHLDKSNMPKKWVLIALGSLWAIFILINVIFTPLLFSNVYKNQLPEPVEKEFTKDIQAVDIKQLPIVDQKLAANLADKKLGENGSLGSQVNPGEPTIQIVDGELVWVVPLYHSGFFKWFANMEGSAGYIVVSATNLKNITYVDDYKIKIQPNSYFLHDLKRKTRFSEGLFTGITDYSFELDDSGKPYWVVTTYKNTCGFNLPEATGIILVDAESGETQKYGMDDVPEWVDRVQPEDFVVNQINNKGEYIHGIFNFSNKDKYRTTEGDIIVYNNGECYLFTGITSVGADESAKGFMMVNMVTKEPVYYKMGGATEASAKRSAQGKVQDLGYYATNPIIINLFDEPTYFMTLKDDADLIKKYAFVNVKDYMIVGVGDTISEAQADYAKSIQNLTDKGDLQPDQSKVKTLNGNIIRIDFTVEDGNTVYYFTLDSNEKVIFKVNLSSSFALPLTKEGDSVSISYVDSDSNLKQITEFKNNVLQ